VNGSEYGLLDLGGGGGAGSLLIEAAIVVILRLRLVRRLGGFGEWSLKGRVSLRLLASIPTWTNGRGRGRLD
jgi:hypothetical protein